MQQSKTRMFKHKMKIVNGKSFVPNCKGHKVQKHYKSIKVLNIFFFKNKIENFNLIKYLARQIHVWHF